MKTLPWVLLLLLAACGSGESGEPAIPETPAQALQIIHDLHEARDHDALIRTRYAEIWKAESEADILHLIARFDDLFANEVNYNEALATYQEAMGVDPDFSEDGSLATYTLSGGTLRLSRMPSEKWGFHL